MPVQLPASEPDIALISCHSGTHADESASEPDISLSISCHSPPCAYTSTAAFKSVWMLRLSLFCHSVFAADQLDVLVARHVALCFI